MSRSVEYQLRKEYNQMESQVIGIFLTMMIALVLAFGTSTLFHLTVIPFLIAEVFLLDYRYYTSTIWSIMYNTANDLGLRCVQCGYKYYCSCDSCEQRRDEGDAVGWSRYDCDKHDCTEQCPKCGKEYSSSFLEDLDFEMYDRRRAMGID